MAKYQNIILNRDRFLIAIQNHNFDEMINLFVELGEIPSEYTNMKFLKMTVDEIIDFVMDNPLTNCEKGRMYQIENLIFGKLFIYAIHHNHYEFIQELTQYDEIDHRHNWIKCVYDICSENMFEFILQNIKIEESNFCSELFDCILNSGDKNNFLIRLTEYNQISEHEIKLTITENNIEIMNFIVETQSKEKIRSAFDNINFDYIFKLSTEMIQLLYQNGIEFDKKLYDLFIFAVMDSNKELIEFCLEYNFELCNINSALGISLRNLEITELLIRHGADIHSIENDNIDLNCISDIHIVKFLVEKNGCNFPMNVLSNILSNMIETNKKIDDLIYVIELGANVYELSNDWIIQVTLNDKVDFVKYLIMNYPEFVKENGTHLIMKCYEFGKIEIIELLSDVIKINYDDKKLQVLFYIVCTYKQYSSIMYLIKLGLDLNAINIEFAMKSLDEKSYFEDENTQDNKKKIIELLNSAQKIEIKITNY